MCINTVILKRGAVLYMDHTHTIVCNGTNYGAGLTNLWLAERFPWHAAFNDVPISVLFLLPDQRLYIVKDVYIYIYISDCVEFVYELPLLPNSAASETLHKLGAMRSVDKI
jgi:hypothetical protein